MVTGICLDEETSKDTIKNYINSDIAFKFKK